MNRNIFRYLLSSMQNIKFACNEFSKIIVKSNYPVISLNKNFKYNYQLLNQASYYHSNKLLNNIQEIQENISSLHMKKRPIRKKKIAINDKDSSIVGYWHLKAFATAEEYNLENLLDGLLKQNLYTLVEIQSSSIPDAIQVIAKYENDDEKREIFFFRQGTVIMWNISDVECKNMLEFLKKFEENSYAYEIVENERELMLYTYTDEGKRSHLKKGDIYLSPNEKLDKYTFSNALSQSVKLSIWETSLDNYIDSIEFITDDLKKGRKIRMTRQTVLRKQGQLFALRHLINLSSDLLDTPDFYWERDDLEALYIKTCRYFNITKRTKVMNDKINHCLELVELLSTHLSDRHHIRLEWMIIILIMVEVAFETLHYLDRYFAKYEEIPIIIN